jgi:hypothetical protein
VDIDHMLNCVTVNFTTANMPVADQITAAFTRFQNMSTLGAGILVAKTAILGPIPFILESVFGGEGGFGDKFRRFVDQITEAMGAEEIWYLGRNEVKAGRPPYMIANPPVKEAPFWGEMLLDAGGPIIDGAPPKGAVMITRDPSPNPQPPSGIFSGNDLRTLVAQVLHDPGLRPPAPATMNGARTREEFLPQDKGL